MLKMAAMAMFISRRLLVSGLQIKTLPAVDSQLKTIFTTNTLNLREIKETKKDNVTTIEGVYKESSKKEKLLQYNKTEGACPLCQVTVRYTDVLIISQFIDSHGEILPKAATGLCEYKQMYMMNLIRKAHLAGLLPKPSSLPAGTFRMETENKTYKKYPVYFDDNENDEESQYAVYKSKVKQRRKKIKVTTEI